MLIRVTFRDGTSVEHGAHGIREMRDGWQVDLHDQAGQSYCRTYSIGRVEAIDVAIAVPSKIACPKCDGTGSAGPWPDKLAEQTRTKVSLACPACDGSGSVPNAQERGGTP